jgi:hypothetical protein
MNVDRWLHGPVLDPPCKWAAETAETGLIGSFDEVSGGAILGPMGIPDNVGLRQICLVSFRKPVNNADS